MNAATTTASCAAGNHDRCNGSWTISERMAVLTKTPAGTGPCSCGCHKKEGA